MASCRATGVACAGGPSIIDRISTNLDREAQRLAEEARASRVEGDLHAALHAVSQARALLGATGKQWQRARLIPLEALILLELGRSSSALEVTDLGLPILRGTGDAREALVLHLVRGLARIQTGDAVGGIEEFVLADNLRSEMADAPDLSEVDLLYARLALRLGRLEMATRALGRVEEATRGPGETRLKAGAHHSRGEVLHMSGELAAALGEHGLALSIEHQSGSRAGVVRQLLVLSRLFFELGHLDVAYQLARHSAELSTASDLGSELARSDVLLGRIGEELGTPWVAAKSYMDALSRGPETLFVGSGDRLWAEAGAWRLCRSGLCGPSEPPLPLLPARLSGQRAEVLPPLTPETLLASALVARELLSRGQRGSSQALLEGIETLMTIPLPPASGWRIHHQLGLTWRELGGMLKAREHLKRAQALLEVLRNGLDVHLLRRDLSHHRRAVYEDLVDTFVGRSAPPPPPGDIAEAFVASELMKARGTLELFREAAGGSGSSAAKLVRHARVSRALMKRLESQPAGEGAWEATPSIARLCEVWSGMRWSVEKATDEVEPDSLDGLHERVEGLLPPDTALLSYQTGLGRSYLWVVRRDGTRIHHLPGVEELGPAAERYLKTVLRMRFETDGDFAEHLASGRALTKMVLGPALEDLEGVGRLVVAADGPLQGLPFSTLITRDNLRSGVPEYLVRSVALTHVPSAGVWAALAARDGARWRRPRSGFLAVGDPQHVPRASAPEAPGGDLNVRVEFHDGSVTFVTDTYGLGQPLGELTHSRAELKAIARIMGKGQSQVLLGPEATEARLGEAGPEQVRYLHFATHGLTDVEPLLPGELARQLGAGALGSFVSAEPALVLSRAAGDDDDGLLRLEEILELELSADLVVLSACSTGRGGRHLGDAVHGLAGAFLYAGSRRAVASMWSVADKQTSALMVSLYQGLQRGLGPDEALRQAQVRLLFMGVGGAGQTRGVSEITDEVPAPLSERARAPRQLMTPWFWAPFVVVGD